MSQRSVNDQVDLVVQGEKSQLWHERERLIHTDRSHLERSFLLDYDLADTSCDQGTDTQRESFAFNHQNAEEEPSLFSGTDRELYQEYLDSMSSSMDPKRKTVTFRKRGSGTITVLGGHQQQDQQSPPLVNGYDRNGFNEGKGNSTHNGTSKSWSKSRSGQKLLDTQWYTRPLHLGSQKSHPPCSSPVISASTTLTAPAPSPVNGQRSPSATNSLHSDDKPPSLPVHRTDKHQTLTNCETLTKTLVNNEKVSANENTLKSRTLTSPMDKLAKANYPITLGAGYDNLKPFNADSNPQLNGQSQQSARAAKGLPVPDPTPWRVTSPKTMTSSSGKSGSRTRPGSGHSSSSSRSRSRRSCPDSAHSSCSSASKNSLDKLYLMAVEAPATVAGTDAALLMSSPYTSELARLRMDRLRIEEEHLLEVKRQEELERIRGPQPKWYELKNTQFHYEAAKNNDLLDSERDWQALIDYRSDLERASRHYNTTYQGTATTSSS